MKYQKLVNSLHSIVKKLDYVDLFCMMGSVVAGTDTKESDIDFYVLLKDIKFKNDFIKQMSKVLESHGEQKHYFKYKNKRISIHIHSTKEIDAKVNNLFRNKDIFIENEWIARGYIMEAFPIYNPKKIFERYQEKIKHYPKKIKRQIIGEDLEFLKMSIHFLKRGIRSSYYFMDCLKDDLKAIYQILYALNDSYYLPFSKRVHNDLNYLKPGIKKELDYITIESNTQKKMKRKLELLEKIYNRLKKASSK